VVALLYHRCQPTAGAAINFETNGTAPWDSVAADSAHWSLQNRLFYYLDCDTTLYNWCASEYLKVANNDYLAAFEDMCIVIRQMFWLGPILAVGDRDGGRRGGQVRLFVYRDEAGVGEIHFGVELPVKMDVQVEVLDVAGRRVRTIARGELPAGVTRTAWDERDGAGGEVGSGIYFARLVCPGGIRKAKVLVLR
jgi:hypothetical protein